MTTSNTTTSFGSVTRTLHWLTALLILTAIPLGVIANDMAVDADSIALKTTLFSVHKTIGVAAFFVGLIRILWALRQIHPVPLHPERSTETAVAGLIHWLLYVSLMAVPLTGWIHHAAVSGFAPILWPFGQGLPLVPQSETVATIFSTAHEVFTKILVASVLLHIAGALKHHLIDRDDTLRRMSRGTSAPARVQSSPRSRVPMLAAFAIYAAGAALTYSLLPTAQVTAAAAPAPTSDAANWQVSQGNLGLSVKQMGATVDGSFATWTADIQFDETASTADLGQVTVSIDLGSLALGSVSDQAKSADFLDTATHPTASFTAKIQAEGDAYKAVGTLTLHGITAPLTLPFSLQINGDTAIMQGETTLDRRDFGIGATYSDEATVGFPVTISVNLTAKRT